MRRTTLPLDPHASLSNSVTVTEPRYLATTSPPDVIGKPSLRYQVSLCDVDLIARDARASSTLVTYWKQPQQYNSIYFSCFGKPTRRVYIVWLIILHLSPPPIHPEERYTGGLLVVWLSFFDIFIPLGSARVAFDISHDPLDE